MPQVLSQVAVSINDLRQGVLGLSVSRRISRNGYRPPMALRGEADTIRICVGGVEAIIPASGESFGFMRIDALDFCRTVKMLPPSEAALLCRHNDAVEIIVARLRVRLPLLEHRPGSSSKKAFDDLVALDVASLPLFKKRGQAL